MFGKWLNPLLLLFCVLTLLAGGVAYMAQKPGWASLGWAAGSLVMALVLLVEIAQRLARREAGVDLIALMSMVAALVLEQMLVAAVIALMLATGRTLEFFTRQRAERELRALIDRAPRFAWLQEQGGLRRIPVEQIQPQQTLLVRLGEVIPVDGRLLSPAAILDESALSGESLPVTRRQGEQLPSGVSNVGAPFLLTATRTAAQSTYAGIVRLAETARRSRAPFVRLADRYALLFIPLTLLIATVAWQMSGDPLRVLAVLVVATPCPLILAVPISIMSGISRAARRGILIKDGTTLEALAGIRQVFLDKTGTLTSGHARLQSIEVNGLANPQHLLGLAASLAQASTHPICQAMVEAAHQHHLSPALRGRFRNILARGFVVWSKAGACVSAPCLLRMNKRLRLTGARPCCAIWITWRVVAASSTWTGSWLACWCFRIRCAEKPRKPCGDCATEASRKSSCSPGTAWKPPR